MPEPILTDDEIVKLYLDGVAFNKIRANDERIKRVLTERGVTASQKRAARQHKGTPGMAPPNEWLEQLKATAAKGKDLPLEVPQYTGASRLRQRLNARRRRESRGTLNLA
ncbi:MAG TPA: hypothetical protein VFG60_09855 [Burkholderiaceae bacterium]|nr:hypothetical protein [Burkholderiaceae bacterium]